MSLRVGIVGLGTISAEHISGWRSVGADIVATADPRETPQHLPLTPESVTHYRSLDDMLRFARLDAIDICTPHHLHWGQLQACVLRCPTLVEKPLVTSFTDLSKLERLWSICPHPVIMRTNKRFEPHVVSFVEHLKSLPSQIPVTINIVWLQRPEYMRERAWYHDRQVSGGGVVLGMGIHLFDIIATYLPAASMKKTVLRTSQRYPNAPGTSVENYARLQLTSGRVTVNALLSCWRQRPHLPFERWSLRLGESETASYSRIRATSNDLKQEFSFYTQHLRNGTCHPADQVVIQAHRWALSAYAIAKEAETLL